MPHRTDGRRFQVRELATLDRSPTLRRSASVLLVLLVASLALLLAPSAGARSHGAVRRGRRHRVHQRHHPDRGGRTGRRRLADGRGRRHHRHRHHRRRRQVDRAGHRGRRLHGHPRPRDAPRGRVAAQPVGQPPHGHGHAGLLQRGAVPPRRAGRLGRRRSAEPQRVRRGAGETDAGETGARDGCSSTEGGFSWPRLAQQIVSGIVFGLLLALASVGLSLIYGTTGLSSFAHGEQVTLGGLLAYIASRRSAYRSRSPASSRSSRAATGWTSRTPDLEAAAQAAGRAPRS